MNFAGVRGFGLIIILNREGTEVRCRRSDVGGRGKGHIRKQMYLKLLYVFLHKGQLNSFPQYGSSLADGGDGHVVCLFIEKTLQR